ncbi:hypothetical protein RUND412_008593 [Rhizina undulata]
MRSPLLISILFACLVGVVLAWSKEDHEIFRLRDEVELYEGEGVTFYDFIGVKNGRSASQEDLNKAYKKTSIRLHPDKHKPKAVIPGKKLTPGQIKEQHKLASERFARLGVVAAILRGPARERYDHFLKNGFPRWRGTGYYYARFRPGLGSVITALFVVGGGAIHYVILWLNARQHRQYMQKYIQEARAAAWGSSGIPDVAALGDDSAETSMAEPKLTRAERRANKGKLVKDNSGTSTPVDIPRRKVITDNGKVFIVDGIGNVFLVGKNEDGEDEEFFLDLNEIQGPKWENTFLFRLPKWIYNKTVGRVIPAGKAEEEFAESSEEDEVAENSGLSSGNEKKKAAPKKKGVAKKIERTGDGVPRRKVVSRKSAKQK